ncbi:MAG TPA: transglutaminase family protein [Tepidisphaeraceae bacterium]|jgi:transglutaminase-like putative cysteine protease|nr:transglutaminase family protein [Tepidisphaeraceae bacterium]
MDISAKEARRIKVRHKTIYTYQGQVQASKHSLHLRPIDDWRQRVVSYELKINPSVPVIEFEDVFGNWAQRFELKNPYQQLEIEATSTVDLLDVDPFDFANHAIHPQFPLVWMPWERTMLAPYLAPRELPDTQIQELFDYAMSFVSRNNGDLMETLFDINLTLFHEYRYSPGSTTLFTTPYDVFVSKQGVCQDFSNLFINLARLLGIPARYVCGYIHTGNSGTARAGSDATHAWVQLYIPHIGWKGFDPTNGVLPTTNHIRTGYGRHFRDVAPTSGTILGLNHGNETLTIDIEVTDLNTQITSSAPPPNQSPEALTVTTKT